MHWVRTIATCLCLFWSMTGHSSVLKLLTESGSTPVMPYADLFIDESGTLSVEQIHTQAKFAPANMDTVSFGFNSARIWLRFRIENTLPIEQKRILFLRQFLLNEVILYQVQEGDFVSQFSGRYHLDQRNTLPTRFFNFEVLIPPHSTSQFYLSIQSEDAISSTLDLSSQDSFQRTLVRDTVAVTFYAGLILTNLFFALFMLVSLREHVLLYYLGFLVFHHLIAILMLEGVPAALFDFHNLFWNRTGFIFLTNVAITLAVLFSREFLRLKDRFPRYYLMSRILVILMLVSTLQSLILPQFFASALTTVFCMIVGIGIIAFCVRCVAKDDHVALLFLISWSFGILGATIYGLKLWNILPINMFTTHAWHIGAALESVLFTYTIANRVALERRIRLQTQTELTAQERALRKTQERLLSAETAAKQDLEQQVQERTQDITRILGELEDQNKQLTELSINDGLTKVRNRRFFNDTYPNLWQKAIEQSSWISVILLDIDHFKSVNDNYGHLSGDQCLIKTAQHLKEIVTRPNDIICRYGGEEFIIVLLDTSPEAACQVAERLRQQINAKPVAYDQHNIALSASFGVAGTRPEAGQAAEALLARCDHALYQSKDRGRNQVTLAA